MNRIAFIDQDPKDEFLSEANEAIHRVNVELVPVITKLERRVEELCQMVIARDEKIADLEAVIDVVVLKASPMPVKVQRGF